MDRAASAELVVLLRAKFADVQAIYLFGSQRPGGGARPDSDVDVAVLLPPQTKTDPVALWAVGSACADIVHTTVDLLSLRETTTVMQHQVINQGVRLFHSGSLDVDIFEIYVDKEKNSLDAARAPLMEDIGTRGNVYGR